MNWEKKRKAAIEPEFNELGSTEPMYPHVSEAMKDADERDIYRELRSITLGVHAVQRQNQEYPIGYSTKYGYGDTPDGLTYSA